MMARMRRAAASTAAYLALLIRSATFWQGLGAIGLFWALASTLEFLTLYVGVSIILLVVSFGVLLSYLPGFLAAMVAGKLNDGEQLVLGIWVAWTGDVMLRIWAVTQRMLDQPAWMLTSHFVTFIIFIKLLGATLHLTSPGSSDGRVPRGNWVLLAVAFALGGIVTAVMLLTTIGAGLLRGV